jgi:hypothetical protein
MLITPGTELGFASQFQTSSEQNHSMMKECSPPTLFDPVLGWLFDFVTKCWLRSVTYSRIREPLVLGIRIK